MVSKFSVGFAASLVSQPSVVVLTSSDQIRDVNRAYQLGANSFFVKDWISRAPSI